MSTVELETMRLELDGPLARLRLNRPEVLNAANRAWVQDLVAVTDYLAQRVETRVVLVSGEGRAFCSGLDTKELAQGKLTVEWFETWERGVTTLVELDAITIAAIQGYCLGAVSNWLWRAICASPAATPSLAFQPSKRVLWPILPRCVLPG